MDEKLYYVYIMASRSRTIYIGITSELMIRVRQHQNGRFEGFTDTYNCHRLAYFERFAFVHNAISREKQMKRWSRAKKIWLIEQENPTWEDLSEEWGKPIIFQEPGPPRHFGEPDGSEVFDNYKAASKE